MGKVKLFAGLLHEQDEDGGFKEASAGNDLRAQEAGPRDSWSSLLFVHVSGHCISSTLHLAFPSSNSLPAALLHPNFDCPCSIGQHGSTEGQQARSQHLQPFGCHLCCTWHPFYGLWLGYHRLYRGPAEL
jgi:hypothetical protein